MLLLSILLVSLSSEHITCFKAAPGRVIGGKYAAPGQFPYQIFLIDNASNGCGGSIISSNWILTAGHCAVGKNPADFIVFAGTTDLAASDTKKFNVAQVVVHPKYNQGTDDYDMALLRVSQPIPLGGLIQKIDLVPANAKYPANTMATVSGFGATNAQLNLDGKLQYANVPLWDRVTCQRYARITDRMVCAGEASGQVSACQGDSGGPLTVNGKLYGAVSFGPGCGEAGPAMYAFIPAFRSWIQQVSGV